MQQLHSHMMEILKGLTLQDIPEDGLAQGFDKLFQCPVAFQSRSPSPFPDFP